MRIELNDWLRLYALVFTFFLLILALFLMEIIPGGTSQPTFIEMAFSSTGVKSPETERDVAITVTRDGSIFFGRNAVRASALESLLRAVSPHSAIRVYVASKTPFKAVRQVVVAARNAGKSQLTFMAKAAPGGRRDSSASSLPTSD